MPGVVSSAVTQDIFRSNVQKLKRDRKQVNVQIGERGTLDFGTDDKSVSVVDFQFIPINPFLEIPKEPSSN